MIEINIENKDQICDLFREIFNEYNVVILKHYVPLIQLFNIVLRKIDSYITVDLYLKSFNFYVKDHGYVFEKYNIQSSEEFWDEIYIFKELILPKYLITGRDD